MERPRISVIMITYNQENLVGRTLDSLLVQKEYLYEICINDDCSQDGTWRVLEDYAARFPSLVKPVRNEQNLGIMQNTEAVWRRPTGDLIYDIAGDDVCPPDYFRKVLGMIDERNIDWKDEAFCIYCDYVVEEPDGSRTVFKNSMVERHDACKLKLRMLISSRGSCFSKKILDRFENVSVGRSTIAESTQDGQLPFFADKNYYLPAIGCIYFAGIGISSRMNREEHRENRADGYRMYAAFLAEHGKPFDKRDLDYIRFIEADAAGQRWNRLRYFFASIDPSLGLKGLNLDRILFALKKRIRRRKREEAGKPSILFIAPFPPPLHGSAVVSQQIRDSRLVRDSFSCDFINLSTSRDLSELGKNNLAKCGRFLSAFFRLFWKLATRQPDLCYLAITCHGRGFLKDFPFVLLCKLFRRKLIIHQHNKGMSEDVGRWPYRRLLPIAYRNATVILLSERLYPDIERNVRRENVVICPNGIAVPKERGSERINDVPKLLFLSNFLENKGIFDLLDALSILKKMGISFSCDFVGGETTEIDERRFVAEVKKRDLSRTLTYHGRKSGAEKELFLDQADCLVLPTIDDCFPLVILEAMAHSLPVITTDEGGIPDMVKDGENGLICRKRDPQSLADCILRMIVDKELRVRMGKDGYEKFQQSFTEERFEERMVGILSKLTAK